jgi:hypothetical protein
MSEALRFCEVELASLQFSGAPPKLFFGAFAIFNVEIEPDPTDESSVARSKGFGATEEPAIRSLSATNSKSYLTPATLA